MAATSPTAPAGTITKAHPTAIDSKHYSAIVHTQHPAVLEFPFSDLGPFLTGHDRFFVRNHFSEIPEIDCRRWRLRIEGSVGNPQEFSLDDLLKMPPKAVVATIECAGNGRAFLQPKTAGIQWRLGAVGTAEWTGVPLASLLQRAGVVESAVEVVLEGADKGTIEKFDSDREMSYARSLPISKALAEGVLLAYGMNGRAMPREHGYPLRAIVPGWYGMASVKWLQRIVATEKPFTGYFQLVDYSYWRVQNGSSVQKTPVTELEVKAVIARPEMNELIAAGSCYRIQGAAWSGGSVVTEVEVSTDNARTWSPSSFLDPGSPHAWRRWEYYWTVPRHVGCINLLARATDKKGRTQPISPDILRSGYMISHVLPVSVRIR